MAETLGHLIKQSMNGRRRGDVAKALDVHRNTIRAWIVGTRVPNRDSLRALRDHLGWPDDIFEQAALLAAKGQPSKRKRAA